MKNRTVVRVFGAVILVGIIATAAFVIRLENISNNANQSQIGQSDANNQKQISYKGQNGETALELLEKIANIEISGEGEMAYVTSINGIVAEANKEFWSFLINEELASVGAGSYTTKNSDMITWKLVKILE